ncbi:putative F-box-like domain superfamily protein [Helianthus anomalus]
MEKIGFQMIVDEIFTRLPAKTFGRFKCVSKNFHGELSSLAFEMMHSRRIRNSLQMKLLSFKDTSIVVDNILGRNLDVVTRKIISFPNNVHHTFLHIL